MRCQWNGTPKAVATNPELLPTDPVGLSVDVQRRSVAAYGQKLTDEGRRPL